MPETRLVRWTTSAAEDLREITRYIRGDSPTAARAVAKALFDAANSLDTASNRGRKGRIPSTRELIVAGLPYIIVYEVEESAVQILHIYHAARKWSQ